MDSYEATRVVFSRIQNLDPENASKIMGLLLIHDHGEKGMIRIAFGAESLSFGSSISFSRYNSSNFSASSSRLLNGINLPSPLSIPNPSSSSSSWAASSNFSEFPQTPDDLISPNSYPNHYNINGVSNLGVGCSSSSTMNSSALPFYGKWEIETDIIDEFHLQEQLSFLNDGPKPPDFYNPQSDLTFERG